MRIDCESSRSTNSSDGTSVKTQDAGWNSHGAKLRLSIMWKGQSCGNVPLTKYGWRLHPGAAESPKFWKCQNHGMTTKNSINSRMWLAGESKPSFSHHLLDPRMSCVNPRCLRPIFLNHWISILQQFESVPQFFPLYKIMQLIWDSTQAHTKETLAF